MAGAPPPAGQIFERIYAALDNISDFIVLLAFLEWHFNEDAAPGGSDLLKKRHHLGKVNVFLGLVATSDS